MGDAKRREIFEKEIAGAIIKWKEVNKVMDLKIIFTGNATLIGEYKDNILTKPRAVAVGTDPHGRGVMTLQMLIGEPDEVTILAPSIIYDVKDEKVINLYIQATTGIIPAKDLSNVRPIRGGNGGGKLPPPNTLLA